MSAHQLSSLYYPFIGYIHQAWFNPSIITDTMLQCSKIQTPGFVLK